MTSLNMERNMKFWAYCGLFKHTCMTCYQAVKSDEPSTLE